MYDIVSAIWLKTELDIPFWPMSIRQIQTLPVEEESTLMASRNFLVIDPAIVGISLCAAN